MRGVRARRLLRRAIASPKQVPRALAGRLLPGSRWGRGWIARPDGCITFRPHGFVAAGGPEMLLARHNLEVLAIDEALAGASVTASLEVGCGFGRLSPHLARFSSRHIAVDINAEAIAIARSSYPSIDFREASVLSLPFLDAAFELVTTWTVLQHIRPELIETAAKEIRRVLSSRGILLICEETRLATATAPRDTHTWHRTVDAYRGLFPELSLRQAGPIAEIDRIPGMTSPGWVMLFEGSDVPSKPPA